MEIYLEKEEIFNDYLCVISGSIGKTNMLLLNGLESMKEKIYDTDKAFCFIDENVFRFFKESKYNEITVFCDRNYECVLSHENNEIKLSNFVYFEDETKLNMRIDFRFLKKIINLVKYCGYDALRLDHESINKLYFTNLSLEYEHLKPIFIEGVNDLDILGVKVKY